MKLYAKVTSPDSGYDSDKERIKRLNFSKLYEVKDILMGQSSTTIHLCGDDEGYNSVQFTFYDEKMQEVNIYATKEFNPYIRMRY